MDLYLALGRRDEAASFVRSMSASADKAAAPAALLRIALLDHARSDQPAAYRSVDTLIAEKPHRIDARLAKTRMLLNSESYQVKRILTLPHAMRTIGALRRISRSAPILACDACRRRRTHA